MDGDMEGNNKMMILYDLTVQDEWRQEPEAQVWQPSQSEAFIN